MLNILKKQKDERKIARMIGIPHSRLPTYASNCSKEKRNARSVLAAKTKTSPIESSNAVKKELIPIFLIIASPLA